MLAQILLRLFVWNLKKNHNSPFVSQISNILPLMERRKLKYNYLLILLHWSKIVSYDRVCRNV